MAANSRQSLLPWLTNCLVWLAFTMHCCVLARLFLFFYLLLRFDYFTLTFIEEVAIGVVSVIVIVTAGILASF